MEPNQPTIPNEIPQAPPPQVAADAEKFKSLIEKWKQKYIKLPPKNKKIVISISVLFIVIFFLLIIVSIYGKKQNYPVLVPTPTPLSVTPAPNVILNASRYATDEGVLKIESDLNNFQKQLETSDVKQGDLNLPNLDFNINFNK